MEAELLLKAEHAQQNGQSQLAYELLSDFLRREPGHPRALMDMAVVCHSQGRTVEAMAAFDELLRLDENNLTARRSLAMALASLQRWPEAEAQLAFILERLPEDHALWSLQARAVNAQGRRNEALAHMDKAIKLAPRQLDYVDLRAALAGLPKPGEIKKKSRLVMCCVPGMDNFVHEILRGLAPYMQAKAIISSQPAEHLEAIKGASVVWLEWGNQMTEFLSKQHDSLAGKQVIIRIHSYEVLDGLADKIDFSRVTDVIFVSKFMKELFLLRHPELAGRCRVHVIHNGIDLGKFAFTPRDDSRRHIAFLGYISYKKDPMVLMQAFAFLNRRHPETRLHVGGGYQDPRYEICMPHFVAEAGLAGAVTFYGHVKNPDEWLKDKDFIICTSPIESQGVGLLEAMSLGCRPLIRNFPGSRDLYRANQIWSTFDELEDLLLNGPSPEESSRFVADRYSLEHQLDCFLKVVLNKEQVDERIDLS